jgi:hypothetical protein
VSIFALDSVYVADMQFNLWCVLVISYAGGLDVKNGTTGETSVYTVFQDR